MNQEQNFCGVINALTEEGIRNNDDYSVLNIRTIYNDNGLETEKLLINGLDDDAIVNMNISVDLASPINFLKENVLHELKLSDPQFYTTLKILPVDEKIGALHCGFTNDTINIIRKILVRKQSNG